MFVTVTGDHLIFEGRIIIYRIILIGVTSVFVITLHFIPPYIESWEIPCYILSFLVMGVTLSIFRTMFWSLFRAVTLLNNCFKVRNSNNFIEFWTFLFSNPDCFYIFLGKLINLTLSSSLIIY
jgi:hypothetical protein